MTVQDPDLTRLARASYRTALLTLLSFVLVGSAMIYSAYRLNGLQQALTDKELELRGVDEQLRATTARLTEAQGSLDRLGHDLQQSRNAAEHIRRGINHYQRGEYRAAIVAYRTALEMDPSNFVVYDWMGYAHYRAGQLADAVAALREAVNIAPGYASGYYNLSLALWRSGDRDGALDALARAIEIAPELRATVKADGQFSPFRQSERFRQLLQGA